MNGATAARITPLRDTDLEPIRTPPHNNEAEQALLGALLINNAAYARVSEFLQSEHFGNAVHARIYAAIGKLVKRGQIANPVTLKNLFDQDSALSEVGGAQFLGQLAVAAAMIINAEDYGRAIHDLYLRRQLIALGEDVVNDAFNFDLDRLAPEIISSFKNRLTEISGAGGREDLVCETIGTHAIAQIPPRPWAYGKFLLLGYASVIGAVDGGGKGAQAVAIALSMITGRSLLAERVWRPGPVVIVTYEDKVDEWDRRIAAACIHYAIDYESVIGKFHFLTRRDRSPIRFAAQSRDGTTFPDSASIVQRLKEIGAVLLIIDPFNHAHDVEDGNNNVAIARVAGEVSRIAEASDAAVLVLHHLRKGSTGDPDDLMGATSLRANFRSCRILARMTADEAKQLKVSTRQRFRYSRIAGTKENYAPPPELATWYRFESVALGNAAGIYIDGDEVHVTTTWTAPSAFEDLSLQEIADIFAKLRTEPGPGLRYSPDKRSDEWVGVPIVEVTGLPDEQVVRIIKGWIETAVLIEAEYRHPKHRKPRGYVTLNETKAANILGSLYTPETDQ